MYTNKEHRKKMLKEKLMEIAFRNKFPRPGHGTRAGGVVGPLGIVSALLSKKYKDFKRKIKGDFPD